MTQRDDVTQEGFLHEMIEQRMRAHQAQEEEQQRQAQEKRQQEEQQAEQHLQKRLESALTPEVRSSISMTFYHAYERGQRITSARFGYGKFDWYLTLYREGWNISLRKARTLLFEGTRASGIPIEDLQNRLLLELGKYRQTVQEQEAKLQARADALRQEQARDARYQAEQAARTAQLIAQADAEHHALTAQFARERKQAEATLWHWLPGVEIEVYHLEYCKGSYREDGETSFDYDGGWTASPALDEHGRIRLEETSSRYAGTKGTQVIQLLLSVHLPTWTVHHYSSVEELPDLLKREVTVSLPNVVQRRNHDLDGKVRLTTVERLDYDEHEYSETIGVEPVAWIKALVQATAQEA